MKTIRNLFEQKHENMDDRLDRVRKRALDAAFTQDPDPSKEAEGRGRWCWIHLVRAHLWAPCRPAWVGMAALWLVIGVLRLFTPGTEGGAERSWAVAPAEGPLELIMEQRRMVAELLEDGRSSAGESTDEKLRSSWSAGRRMS